MSEHLQDIFKAAEDLSLGKFLPRHFVLTSHHKDKSSPHDLHVVKPHSVFSDSKSIPSNSDSSMYNPDPHLITHTAELTPSVRLKNNKNNRRTTQSGHQT